MLAEGYDVVGRFNGGANAGHTVVVGKKKFAFHLLPCGLVYPHTKNILGNGTVVSLSGLFEELAPLDSEGISWEGRLFMSDRAHVLFDFHQEVDGVLEARRSGSGGKQIGTTKKGIGPCYTSKMQRNGVRMGQLRDWDTFVPVYRQLASDLASQYDVPIDIEGGLEQFKELRDRALPLIVDGVQFVNQAYNDGKRIITEGANAAMLDVDYGTYPFVTSSSTTAGGVSTGLGLAPSKLECVIGVMKAYTTRVGAGPFPTELTDERGGGDRELNGPETDIGLHMQNVGFEYGVTTGRKRRCGWFDAVVGQYSHMVNDYSSINLTKLDVLDELEELKIAVAYHLNGQRLPIGSMPSTLEDLAKVEVEYETLPGWKQNTVGTTSWDDLPENARKYVERIEHHVGAPITWIGTGPGRDEMVRKGF